MTRRESREKAVCYLYEYAVQPERTVSDIVSLATDERGEETSSFAQTLAQTAVEHLSEIDDAIAGATENWNFRRISRTTLAILRVAVCELYFLETPTPTEIAVNEALELARMYDTDKSIAFVNGVLARVLRELGAPKAGTQA